MLATVLDELGIGGCAIVGHSLGGVALIVDGLRLGLIRRMLLFEADTWEHPTPGSSRNRLAAARRRECSSSSEAAMRSASRARPPLHDFAPEAFEAFLSRLR